MPEVSCSRCSRVLEYGGDRPSFCGYCGQSLGGPAPDLTAAWSSGQTTPDAQGDRTVAFTPGPGRGAEMPERVKGYRLIRQLGRGGMGTVFEAEDSRLGRRVALKIIAPGYVDSPGAVERFRQEGRLASSLAHPRCVFVLEADEADDGRPFIAMELMTGDTLQDLVAKGGPLEVGDAVARALDVVEGLREAHRLGLIHRDVKPSNCFLDGEGRVKVGDFGLSKSQSVSAHLTRTGAFLGTPLYASPEQVKVEPLDGRTDVYSTAATLYFLLTGRAPFDRGDASATMARIVTDPAPSARQARPEVPAGLDRAIRKGLERDLARRFRDLDQFRAALLPFLPGHDPTARLAPRAGAYLFDSFALYAVMIPTLILAELGPAIDLGASLAVALAYFALGDGVGGGTPGKRLLRLRVADAGGREPAGLGRSTLRALVFLGLADLPIEVLSNLDDLWAGHPLGFPAACLAATALGLAALAAPMLGRGPGRPLHDLIARTRVVALPKRERRRSAGPRRAIGRDRGSVTRPVGVMQSVGPYKVRGAVRWEPDRRVLSGEDSTLGREAWIVIRPKGSPAPEPARREATRATRPRWLDGGEQAEGRWDAYIAPAGCPLADLAGPEGLPWPEARPILEDLADELAAACADGTLPPGLTVDQVWVQPDGRAILVDPLARPRPPGGPAEPEDPDDRALALLRRSAALALEGGRRRGDDAPRAIRSPVPLHASAALGRLLGGPDAHPTVAAFRADLEETRNLPAEVGPGQRASGVGILGLLVGPGLAFTFALVYETLAGELDPSILEFWGGGPGDLARLRLGSGLVCSAAFPMIWVIWDFLTRGGFALRLAGLGLARSDGRRPPRWRCAWRSLLVWAPMAALLMASVAIHEARPVSARAAWAAWSLAIALVPVYAALAVASPSCGPHDRLSGLRVVPR